MAPPQSYVISGVIRVNSLIKGSSEVEHVIDTNNNGQTGLNLYMGGGTTTTITTVYIKNLTTEEEISISTGSDGAYVYDLANLSDGYSDEDTILIRVSTYLTNDEDVFEEPHVVQKNSYHKQAGCNKGLLVDSYGNEFNSDNPIPIILTTETLDFLNAKKVITHGGPNRRISQIDWYYKGKHYRQTVTYSGNVTTHNKIEEV